MKIPVTVIILTYNEEKNILACIESVKEITDEVFVVDSFSTDKTIKILEEYNCKIFKHEFENYSKQRNWALQNLPIKNNWIFNLDADHRVTEELKSELLNIFSLEIPSDLNGFLISRRTIFMDKWIKRGGHYPTFHANCFRKGFGKCEEKLYDQHFLVHGKLLKLKGDIIDIIADSLSNFTIRHNKWSTLEAAYQLSSKNHQGTVQANIVGHAIERRRALKSFYERIPLFVRPFFYFFQRYFFRLGFLDGKEGLIFHLLQGFWFRFLIDAKIYEMKSLSKRENKPITQILKEHYGIEILGSVNSKKWLTK